MAIGDPIWAPGTLVAVWAAQIELLRRARRVVHHGLGARGDLGDFTPRSIYELVVSADRPAVRANADPGGFLSAATSLSPNPAQRQLYL